MINIAMKLVMPLGEGRMQLECMCGHQFTYAPADKINTNDENYAKCPKCGTLWDGQIDDLASGFNLKISYFALYARLDDVGLNTQLGIENKPDSCVRIGVGIGADIAHFAMPSIAKFCSKNEPIILMIKKISKGEYDEAKEAQIEKYRANMLSNSVGIMGLLLNQDNKEDDT